MDVAGLPPHRQALEAINDLFATSPSLVDNNVRILRKNYPTLVDKIQDGRREFPRKRAGRDLVSYLLERLVWIETTTS